MKKPALALIIIFVIGFASCDKKEVNIKVDIRNEDKIGIIDADLVQKVKNELIGKFGDENEFRIERGVDQVAALWKESDGEFIDLEQFCIENFIHDDSTRNDVFNTIQRNHEIISGNFNRMSLELQEPVQLDMGEISKLEYTYAAYNPASHLTEDFFKNKAAFITALNFPHYSLKEKNTLSNQWDNKAWAMARVGDLYTERVPASLQQEYSKVNSDASNYIDQYNIYMGKILDETGNTMFPEDMKLITHWNLRDELKSQYDNPDGLEKQKMIYAIMKHIINQTIPEKVINKGDNYWAPISNKLYSEGKEPIADFDSEPDTRYQQLLNNFNALKNIDKYNSVYPTYIKRKFDQEMELTFENVEQIFIELLTSDTRFDAAKLIEQKLGRHLEPFDIWYKGFKTSTGISEQKLDEITKSRYKTPADFEKELPTILTKFGFEQAEAARICDKVIVEPSRGAGHAAGAAMKEDVSRLRTRIGKDGMDYKGYNIAVHEFGHNVEQTITLHDVPNYMMSGVPNNAFTEAVAFVFQSRDMDFLGINNADPMRQHYYALDNFWSTYEIMGVALTDMYVWKWLYDNPDADASQLKAATVEIAKDVWNKYYAEVFGSRDSEILAIYSHTVAYPLYLSAYPIGHLVEFQMETHFKGKNKAEELKRILTLGKMTPNAWMQNAFNTKLSSKPLIDAASEALKSINIEQNKEISCK